MPYFFLDGTGLQQIPPNHVSMNRNISQNFQFDYILEVSISRCLLSSNNIFFSSLDCGGGAVC